MDNLANHPIPQDVTHFQFQLIGNMTVKQFAYLGSGVILGWICFAFPLFIVLKLLLAGLFAGGGVFLAFAPLEGRPADIMLMNFLHAVFSPTIYMYQRPSRTEQTTVITAPPVVVQKKEDKKQEGAMIIVQNPIMVKPLPHEIIKPATPMPTVVSQHQTTSTSPTKEVETVEKKLTEQATALQQAVAVSQKEESLHKQTQQEATLAHQKTVDLEKQLQELLEQKSLLEEQLTSLQKQVMQPPPQSQAVTPTATLQPGATPRVVKVPKSMTTTIGVPLTPDVPNLITGVVKDPRGNVLTNILIEVMDKDGNPVRAFKTNNLGQFASATPLNNGTYTLTLEDPNSKNSFDVIEINASGDIILPLQITSVDQRELLRKELFKA